MKQYIKNSLVAVVMALGLATFAVAPAETQAAACNGTPAECAQQGVNAGGGAGQGTVDVKIKDIVNLLLFVVGIIAVIMIVIGGLRYVLSGGDASAVSAAKNTILYAVVGLVVAILAYAIVNFVISSFDS